MDKNFAEWLYEQEIGDNKDNIFAPPLNAQFAINFLKYYLLGEDWYSINPVSQEQINAEIVDAILLKYSRQYRKDIKDLRKKVKKNGKQNI